MKRKVTYGNSTFDASRVVAVICVYPHLMKTAVVFDVSGIVLEFDGDCREELLKLIEETKQ